MVKVASLLAVLALGAPAAAGAAAELRITYWPEGQEGGTPLRWTLKCGPAGGSLPRPALACAKLARMKRPFAPPAKDRVCTGLYGGPQEAIVAGTFEGRRIWVRLARRNGCQIARFERLRFLTPAFSGGGAA